MLEQLWRRIRKGRMPAALLALAALAACSPISIVQPPAETQTAPAEATASPEATETAATAVAGISPVPDVPDIQGAWEQISGAVIPGSAVRGGPGTVIEFAAREGRPYHGEAGFDGVTPPTHAYTWIDPQHIKFEPIGEAGGVGSLPTYTVALSGDTLTLAGEPGEPAIFKRRATLTPNTEMLTGTWEHPAGPSTGATTCFKAIGSEGAPARLVLSAGGMATVAAGDRTLSGTFTIEGDRLRLTTGGEQPGTADCGIQSLGLQRMALVDDAGGSAYYFRTAEAAITMRTASELNLRAGAGVEYAPVAVLPANAEVQLLGEEQVVGGSRWVKIRFGEQEGWVNATFLR